MSLLDTETETRQEVTKRLGRIIGDLSYLISAKEVFGYDTRRRLAGMQHLIVFLRQGLEEKA